MLRVPLGDFDFMTLSSSYREPGIAFCLVYAVFLVLVLLNIFVVVLFDCFVFARRREARKLIAFYLQDLLNRVSINQSLHHFSKLEARDGRRYVTCDLEL